MGRSILIFTSRRPGPQDGRVDEVLAVRGADDDDVAQRLDAVDLGQQLGHDGRLHVGADAGAPGPEQRVHLVEEDDDRHALLGLLPGPLEDQADLALGLAHVLVEELGALDVEEVAADVGVAGHLGHLLGQRVGHRLGDEGLAAPRRPVEQDPLGGGQLVLGEQLAVQVGQLDGVGDGLDLVVEPADVGVGDVGHLFEDELLDLGPGQLLDRAAACATSISTASPARSLHARAGRRTARPPAPRRPGRRRGTRRPSSSTLLQGDDLTRVLALAHQDHVERLVEDDLVAPAELAGVDVGVQGHPHLAAAREDVDGAVVVDVEERPVGRRRLGELLDLFAQGGELLLGLLQGEGQLLVLRDRPGPAGPWSRAAAPRGSAPGPGSPATGAGARGPRPRRLPARRAAPRPGQRLRRESRSPHVTLALASAAFCQQLAVHPADAPGPAGPARVRMGGPASAGLTAARTPHYGPRGPSGGCDKGESQVHEGLDRPGSLHGRRAVRGDRAGRLHPARRRPGLREGRRRRQERAGRLRRHGRRPRRPRGRRGRGLRGVPRGVHLHRARLTGSRQRRRARRRGAPRSSSSEIPSASDGRMRIVPFPLAELGVARHEATVAVAPPAVDGHAVLPHADVEPARPTR